MKAALLYGSTHGKTRKVVAEVLPRLGIRPDVFDVKDRPGAAELAASEVLLFFCPTYGDEELQADMEEFLAGFSLDLSGRHFAICELGNYSGYDNFSLGAMRIIRAHLLRMNGIELCEPLSLDSFPRLHWGHLFDWVERLNTRLNERL